MLNSKNSLGDVEYINEVVKIINERQQAGWTDSETTAGLVDAHKRFLDRSAADN